MNKEEKNVYEAKKVLKYQIKFLESLKKHVSGPDLMLKHNAMWTSWVLNKYMQQHMIDDVKRAMDERLAEVTTTTDKDE